MKWNKITGILCVLVAFNIVIDAGALFFAHRSQSAASPPAQVVFSTPAPPTPMPSRTPALEDQNSKEKLEKALADARADAAEAHTEVLKADLLAKAAAVEQTVKDAMAKAQGAYDQGFRDAQAKAAAQSTTTLPSTEEAQQTRYRKAQADLAMASREDQLRAALAQKYFQENGPYTSAQFRFLDEETKWTIITYVPWALPPELQGTTVNTVYFHQ